MTDLRQRGASRRHEKDDRATITEDNTDSNSKKEKAAQLAGTTKKDEEETKYRGGGHVNVPLALFGLFQGYLFYNIGRKSLSTSSTELLNSKALKISKTELGLLSSSFSLPYGLSKLVAAVASDYVSTRAMFALGLVSCGIANIVFGFSQQLWVLCFLWGVNGLMQGMGWPSLAKICLHSVSKANLGKAWAFLTASGYVGNSIGPMLLLYAMELSDTPKFFSSSLVSASTVLSFSSFNALAFFVAGACAVLSGLLALLCLPSETLMTEEEKTQKDESVQKRKEERGGKTKEKQVAKPRLAALFANQPLWTAIFANALILFAQKALSEWTLVYLLEDNNHNKETRSSNSPSSSTHLHLSSSLAARFMLGFEVGSIVGTFASGYISDLRGGKSISTMLGFALLCLPVAWQFYSWTLLDNNTPGAEMGALGDSGYQRAQWVSASFFFFVGMGLAGPKTLAGIVVRDLAPLEMSGSASGMLSMGGQVGTALAGAPLGYISQHYGWDALFYVILASIALSSSLMIQLYIQSAERKQK